MKSAISCFSFQVVCCWHEPCLLHTVHDFIIIHINHMKKNYFDFTALLISLIVLSAFVFQNGGTIVAKVNPAEKAFRAYVISGKDTMKSNILAGQLQASQLKAGKYQLIIEALPPYDHKKLNDIQVKEGEITNLGDIQLLPK
jgi:hypothetical protein